MALLDAAIKAIYRYVDTRIESVRPFRAVVIGQANGMVQIRRVGDPGAGETALRARIAGFPLVTNDEVLCVPVVDGIPVIVGKLQRTTPTAVTYDLPVIGEQGFNSPQRDRYSQDSADVSSSTDTANYVTNFDWDWALGSGTWTVWAQTLQACSHSSAGSLVRGRTVVDGSASAVTIGLGMPATPTRGIIPSESLKTGCTGTITIAAQYRPNSSGTGYAGGGIGFALAFRTA